MSYITNGYNTPRIARQPSLNMYDDIRAGEKALSSFGKKYVAPAVKYAGKETLKLTTKPLPTIGSGLGAAAGIATSVATANPELLPIFSGVGAFEGEQIGRYAKKRINEAIDKL